MPATWMRAESAGDVRAVSSAGAMDLMQIMPQTSNHLRARHRLGLDFYNQRDNILAGSAYLREMHDRCGSRDFLATYHAGPGQYEEHLTTGRTLPAETRAYVAALALLVENEPVDSAVVAVASPQSSIRATFQRTRRNQLGSRSPITRRAAETHADRPSRRRPFSHSAALGQPICAACILGKATMTSLVILRSAAWNIAFRVAGHRSQGRTTSGRRDKRGSPVASQALGRACLSPCRSVGSRAARKQNINFFNELCGTATGFEVFCREEERV